MKLVGICGSPREVKNGAKMGQKRGQLYFFVKKPIAGQFLCYAIGLIFLQILLGRFVS